MGKFRYAFIDQHEVIRNEKKKTLVVCIDGHEVITGEMGKVAVCIDEHYFITKENVEKLRNALISMKL